MKTVRTRFAPSPTGYLHVGGIRTALFAWLIARQNNGVFILRLEDTDQKREIAGADEHIMKSLKSLGLNYDEGPDIGGKFGPYRQSQRLESYKEWGQKLVDSGRAYADPYTPEEVQAFRDEAIKNKKPFLYRDHRPDNPPVWDGTQPLRFKSEPKVHKWKDAVMGEMSASPEAVDDFILIKSDGYPTYNLAHIIDDHLMECTHVTRTQEFIASIPRFLNLYEALEINPPILATLPYIMGPDGKKKLSKRDGAKDVLDYIREGFLPEALINFIASLGWNDGTEQEIFSVAELIEKFRLDHVQKSGARFDEKRLVWMNGYYIRKLNIEELYERTTSFWGWSAKEASAALKKDILGLIQERLKYFSEIPGLTSFFFEDLPIDMNLIDNNKQLSRLNHGELAELLNHAKTELEDSDFSTEDLTASLNKLLEATGQKPGVLFSLIRVATTWSPASPALAGTLHLLGREKTLERLNKAIETLAK